MLKLMYQGNTMVYGDSFVGFPDPAHNLYLIQNPNGTITADKMSGMSGEIVTLSNTPATEYQLNSYSITGAALTGNQFMFGDTDVSAEASFSKKVYTLTLQTDGHGTIAATKTTGYKGDTVTLSNTYNTYYRFNNYTQTGGSLNGSTFTFGSQNATAKANFKVNAFTATGNFEKGSNTSVVSTYNAAKSTNIATKYAIHQAHTGNVPTGWYSTSNRWKPNNVSAYKITLATKMKFTTNKSIRNGITAGATAVSLIGSTHTASQGFVTNLNGDQSMTYTYSKSFSTTTQNVNYGVSAKIAAGVAGQNYSTATYVAAGTSGTWTATGYAP